MAALIRGIVRDEKDKPLAAARVHFVSSPVPLPDVAALSGVDGAFALGVPVDGDYGLAVDADGFGAWRRTVRAASGAPVDVVVRLRRA